MRNVCRTPLPVMLRHMGKRLRKRSWKLVIILPWCALREAAFPMGGGNPDCHFPGVAVGGNAYRELAYC
jgi:hypothetical protein